MLIGGNYGLFHSDELSVVYSDIYNRKLNFKILRLLRNNYFLIRYCLEDYSKILCKFDTIIVFDSEATFPLLKWIKNKSKENTRLIMYYRNAINLVRKRIQPDIVKKLGYEIWSYNYHDCQKYNINYNKQVLDRKMFQKYNDNISDILYDVVFLGYTKGRRELLERLNQIFEQNGLITYFYIPDCPDFSNNRCTDGKPLAYYSYIDILSHSKAIIDIVVDDNYGLTLRPLEALYMKRKIITNYLDIVNYDFYSSNNILLIDENDLQSISSFISGEYKLIDDEVVESYSVTKWLQRFFER